MAVDIRATGLIPAAATEGGRPEA